MSDKPEAGGDAKAPAKSKKMLIIIVGVVLVLLLAAGGAFFFISKQRAAADEAGEAAPAKAAAHVTKTAPVYLPLDSMVVNLADPGGEKVAQIGITLEVVDAKASDSVKAFLPTIRNGILKQISKRTSTELLTLEGKEKLAKSILREASIPFGGGEDDEDEEEVATTSTKKKPVKRRPPVAVPVEGVLFSSFIVQ